MWTFELKGAVRINLPPGLSRRANSSSAWVGSGTCSNTSLHRMASKLASGEGIAVMSLTRSMREVSQLLVCKPSTGAFPAAP